jgi:hypothetical protein
MSGLAEWGVGGCMVPECAYEKRVHLSHPHQFFAASDAYSDYQAVDSEGDTQRVSDNRGLHSCHRDYVRWNTRAIAILGA